MQVFFFSQECLEVWRVKDNVVKEVERRLQLFVWDHVNTDGMTSHVGVLVKQNKQININILPVDPFYSRSVILLGDIHVIKYI